MADSKRSRIQFLGAALFLAGGAAFGAGSPGEAPDDLATVRARRIEIESEGPESHGRQFLQVDAKGRLHLLSVDRLEVASERRGGRLVFSSRLRSAPGESDEAGPVVDAAMGHDEGEWLLAEAPTGLRWFKGGREIPLPDLPWMTMAVGFSRGLPTVAVAPAQISMGSGRDLTPTPPNALDVERPPLVLRLEGDTWHPLVADEWVEEYSKSPPIVRELRARGEVRLCSAPKGEPRVAWVYTYRARFFDRSGKLQAELRSGPQEPEWQPLGEAERAAIAATVNELKLDPKGMVTERPRQRIARIACARDGMVYLLVRSEERLVLDRFDPQVPDDRVERVALAGLDVPEGRVSMVAAAGGLAIAPFNSELGAWQVAWEDLASAAWRAVPKVEVRREP